MSKQPDSFEALVAEFARSETGGKVSLLGIFPDKRVVIPKGTAFPVTFPLAIYMAFFGAEDIKDVQFSMIDPGGTKMMQSAVALAAPPAKGKSSIVLVNVPALQLAAPGRYEVTVSLDGQPYTTQFILQFAD